MDVSISREGLDSEWDGFLETHPDGCYQQSSAWAEAQADKNWGRLRLVVREQNDIVGGVQVLLRSLPLFGAVGFVSKGPVMASEDPAIQNFLLDQMDRAARTEHILFLKIQPPRGREDIAQRLLERGAGLNDLRVTPITTAVVDLRPEPDAILAQMHHKTRYKIRHAERKGLIVRKGNEEDIPILLDLARVHGEGRGYTPPSYESFLASWSILSPPGYLSFFIIEYLGEPLAAATFMRFGDVFANRLLVDNGRHRNLNPQSLLHWKAMLWGKEHGCTWYDFGGIATPIARAMMNDEPIPDNSASRRARFKMSFGSQLISRPGVYDVSYVWPRWLTVRMVPFLLKIGPLLRFLIGGSLAKYTQDMDHARIHDLYEETEQDTDID